MDEIHQKAREYRARQEKNERLRDSGALIVMTLLALWLTFDQMIF